MKILVFLALFIVTYMESAESQTLINFHAGTYDLSEGDRERCGQGSFWIFDETKYLMLDALHGFSIKVNANVEPSDIPGEEGCSYFGKNDVQIKDNKTQLTMTSVLKCKDTVRYTLVKRATITNKRIIMFAKQVGEGSTEYKCDWARK